MIQRRLHQRDPVHLEPAALVLIQVTGAKLLLIHARSCAHHTGQQRLGRHFEREDRHSLGSCTLVATCWAMFSASAVLPMDGRAARMISSPSCSPPVISSNLSKPVLMPLMRLLGSRKTLMPPS